MLTATLWVAVGVIAAAFIARGVKISEFRQAWIDGLRDDISEYTCKAHKWADLYLLHNSECESEKKSKIAAEIEGFKYEAIHIHSRISLRFKPDDTVANDFLLHLLDLINPSRFGIDNNAYPKWRGLLDKVVLEARILLKEEWETTKNPLRKLYENRQSKTIKM